jgi:zinc protease
MMFKGSANVGDGEHFRLLQEIGAFVNGSTTEDRTNYYEVVPSSHLDLALYLESDRMGFLLPSLNQEKLDNQKDVVKNERRQSYENQPYGRAHETLTAALFPHHHPYSWPVIGSMADISAATLSDVRSFFQVHYTPANACLVVAGDVKEQEALYSIEKYFGPLSGQPAPHPPAVRNPPFLASQRLALNDAVALPRIYIAWHGPRMETHDDAVLDLLTNHLVVGKNSRLYRTLVYRDQIAQSVSGYQHGMEMAGETIVVATAQKGTTLSTLEDAILREIEKITEEGLTPREFEAALNTAEMSQMENRISALQKANGLATYALLTGDPETINTSIGRYAGIGPQDLRNRSRQLLNDNRVVLSIVPHGRDDLAARDSENVKS